MLYLHQRKEYKESSRYREFLPSCDVGVDPSICGHRLSKMELSPVLFIGGAKEFSCSDTTLVGTPQLLAQFAARMGAKMRKTENYNLTLDSDIRLKF